MADRAGTDDRFEDLRGLVFDMLLVTDGRTTELLETIVREKLGVTVIRQERAGDAGDAAGIEEESLAAGAADGGGAATGAEKARFGTGAAGGISAAPGGGGGAAEEAPAVIYVRESVLSGLRSGLPVSHNVALGDSRHVPPALFHAIAMKSVGIGKAIGEHGLRTFRRVLASGRVDFAAASDLFGRPLALRFPATEEKVPFKKYAIHFGEEPGILLLEYYDPRIVHYRMANDAD